jgi:hypothetical protein
MKTEIPVKQLEELVPAARIAVDNDQSFWDRIADFFERGAKVSQKVVIPRKLND